jgi:hypothetical protein
MIFDRAWIGYSRRQSSGREKCVILRTYAPAFQALANDRYWRKVDIRLAFIQFNAALSESAARCRPAPRCFSSSLEGEEEKLLD